MVGGNFTWYFPTITKSHRAKANVWWNDECKAALSSVSTIYNRKTLGKVIAIFQRLFESNFDVILLIKDPHNLGTQIKGFYKLVSVTKGKLFVSYEKVTKTM